MVKNYYSNSWELYKTHSESFEDDFDYYLEQCKGHKTLELFAGYGRLTNYLLSHGIDIDSVELEPNFAKFINLPLQKNHICDVLDFRSLIKFDRIIAGYNSFCLLTKETDIFKFFQNIEVWLNTDGIVSLSYYHHDFWETGTKEKINFEYQGKKIELLEKYDLSKREEKKGIWIDEYYIDNGVMKFEYPTTLYETVDCLTQYLKGTKLEVFDVIENYRKPNISPGWIEFLLRKK